MAEKLYSENMDFARTRIRVVEVALSQSYELLNEIASDEKVSDAMRVRIRKILPPRFSMSFQHVPTSR